MSNPISVDSAATAATSSARTDSDHGFDKASEKIAAFMSRVVPWPEGPDDGFINVHWHLPGGPFKGVAVRTLDAFMRELERASELNENIYFCLSLQREAKPNGTKLIAVRNQLNATLLKSVFADIDAGEGKPYATQKDAALAYRKFLDDSGLPPASAIVSSGSGGLHLYWWSDRALIPGVWRQYAEGLQALAERHGFHIDSKCTTDSARVLRVPGTLNWKHDPPAPVELLVTGEEYDFSSALGALVAAASKRSSPARRAPVNLLIPARFAGRQASIVVNRKDLYPPMGAEELRLCLEQIPNDKEDWNRWNTIGMRVYAACEGEEYGLEEWSKWSEQLRTKGKDSCEDRWDTYHHSPPTRTGAGALIMEVRRLTGEEKWMPVSGKKNFKHNPPKPVELLGTGETYDFDAAAIYNQVKEGKLNPVTGLMTLRDQGANIDALLAAMNENYAVVKYGGQTIVATIFADDIGFMKVEDFHRMFANLFFDPIDGVLRKLKERIEQIGNDVLSMTVGDFKDAFGDVVRIRRDPTKLSRRWFEWKGRRQYPGRGVVFEPGGPLEISNDMLNLWRGFGVVPKSGDWSLMRAHIFNVVCNGDQELFDYLIKWMAYAVQHPDKPIGVAVAFLGPQGAGKGVVARTFGSFFGKHFVHITHGDQLTGRFNASLGTSCAVFLDEALWAGDKKGEGTLKALITEPTFQMEAKFRDPIMVENRLRIMVASNNEWAVPAGVGDRRWFVLNVAETYAGTKHRDYWTTLYAEIENGGAAAMLHGVLAMDLSGFDVRALPHTAAKAQQQAYSFRGPTAWLYDILQEGAIGQEKWNEAGLTISKDHAYDSYKEFSKERREWQPDIKDLWSRQIRKVLGPCVKDARHARHTTCFKLNDAQTTDRVRSFKFAPLADCRRRFETHVCAPNIEWEAAVAPEPATGTTVRQTADHLGDPTVLDAVGDAPSIECEQESEPEDWADYGLNCESEDEPEYESEDGSN